jgi:hypothetical protein
MKSTVHSAENGWFYSQMGASAIPIEVSRSSSEFLLIVKTATLKQKTKYKT